MSDAKDVAPMSHPLDGCDDHDLYKTMMAERTDLDKARREAEDDLVKTIIQFSSTIIALISGFSSQNNIVIYQSSKTYLYIATLFLVLALATGLLERALSSKAYRSQQKMLEAYYTKTILNFTEPIINKYVRLCHKSCFVMFVAGLSFLGIFGYNQLRNKDDGRQKTAGIQISSKPATARISR